jgi:hypothetical protein
LQPHRVAGDSNSSQGGTALLSSLSARLVAFDSIMQDCRMRAPLMLMMSLTNVLVCGGNHSVCSPLFSVTTGVVWGVRISGIRIRIRPWRRSDYRHVPSRGVVVCDLIVCPLQYVRLRPFGGLESGCPGRRRAPHYLW